jgi:hypothetical protein
VHGEFDLDIEEPANLRSSAFALRAIADTAKYPVELPAIEAPFQVRRERAG